MMNSMAANLTGQVRNIAEVTTAVPRRPVEEDHGGRKGEILELKSTINTMVDPAERVRLEVSRVAREVGTDGKPGAGAGRQGWAGHLEDLTDNVNSWRRTSPAGAQHRGGDHGVAKGDLSKKITVDVKGEILELKSTINTMVDQLKRVRLGGSIAVAREVGTEASSGPGAGARSGPDLEGSHR